MARHVGSVLLGKAEVKAPLSGVDPQSVTETIGASTPEFSSEALRAAVLALRAPQAAKRAPAPTSSVFGRAAAAVPDDAHPATARMTLQGRFRSVETSALLPGTTIALLWLPDLGEATVPASLQRSCQIMVDAGATVVVLGTNIPRQVSDPTRPITVPLRADDALADEWGLIACGPARRVAFLARKQHELDDMWSWISTRDAVAIHRAATAILERVPFLRLRVPALAN
jgi:hypothetical protein